MFTTLSILVYLAEVIERVEDVTFGIGLFFGISACISLIIMGCCAAENEFDTSKAGTKKWCKYTFISVIVAIVCIAMSAFIPTKKAVYMIRTSATKVSRFSRTWEPSSTAMRLRRLAP